MRVVNAMEFDSIVYLNYFIDHLDVDIHLIMVDTVREIQIKLIGSHEKKSDKIARGAESESKRKVRQMDSKIKDLYIKEINDGLNKLPQSWQDKFSRIYPDYPFIENRKYDYALRLVRSSVEAQNES